ncbi:MAG: DUF2950 family protein [Pseudomonadales bacterium]
MRRIGFCVGGMLLLLAAGCQPPDPGVFETPEGAVGALAAMVDRSDGERIDDAQIEAIFGPGSADLFRSGDDEADREDVARVRAMIESNVTFEDFDEQTKIALLGDAAWPWPIPLTRVENGWRFDTEAGREELLNRRIGRNELWTLAAMHEIVDAQREYRQHGRDGKRRAYARQFLSSEGNHDGLYWPADEIAGESPLGALLADSEARSPSPQPFHGYLYRMLTRQGEHAPGGERDYLNDDGLMTGGFAVIAWPAKYGNSGVMTFITNRQGLVYQQDLGQQTEETASAITAYDPDISWVPTPDRLPETDQL